MIRFFVPGVPIPKQSFHYTRHGGYTDPRTKAWQNKVILYANQNVEEMIQGEVQVWLTFLLPDKHKRDADNLSKCVLDGLNGIAFKDDRYVTKLVIEKVVNRDHPGVLVSVRPFTSGT